MSSLIFRVFVSSTYEDLRPERKALEAAIQRFRETKFEGMEYTGSRHESPRNVSLHEVDRSDIYIGIVAGRYGSGITQAEYLQAKRRGLPCRIYLKKEGSSPEYLQEQDTRLKKRLQTFKDELLTSHTCSQFENPDQLATMVTADLHNWLADRTLELYVNGIRKLPTDFSGNIRNFVVHYLGTPARPVAFGGRGDDLEQLHAWLEDPEVPPFLLLAAPAGRGKSALLVHWSECLLLRNDIAVVFVPVSVRFGTNLSIVVFSSLVARLAALHDDVPPGDAHTPAEVWRSLFLDYLRKPLPNNRTLVVILDGVDEASDFVPGPTFFPLDPPASLRLVISARYLGGDVNANGWLNRLGWDQPGLASSIDLEPLDHTGVAEALVSMGLPFTDLSQDTGIVAELYRLSEGDPLLVELYAQDLRALGDGVITITVEELAAFEPGIDRFFERWWHDQEVLWGQAEAALRPAVQAILNLLACALGPLSLDDLLRLAPNELTSSLSFRTAMKPLARFVIGDGRRQGYVFSHPRLVTFFYDELSDVERRSWQDRFLAWGKEIQDGLDGGIVKPRDVPAYLVEYFGAHLVRGGAGAIQLSQLVSDSWRRAWETREGSYAGFLHDVERAWQAAQAENSKAIEAGQRAPFLGLEVLCALCRSSVASLGSQILPELVGLLVDHGIWSVSQALAYARADAHLGRRAKRLADLAARSEEEVRPDLRFEALETAKAIGSASQRATMLTALAFSLGEEWRDITLADALEAALAIGDDFDRSRQLRRLASHLDGKKREAVLSDALKAARGCRENRRVLALSRLVPVLADKNRETVLNEALETAESIGSSGLLAGSLTTLAPYLTAKRMDSAIKIARGITYTGELVSALSALAQHSSTKLGEIALAETLEGELEKARALGSPRARASALRTLVEHLDGSLRETVLGEALDAVQEIELERDRETALRDLAAWLSERQFTRALLIAREIKAPRERAKALLSVASRLSTETRGEVILEVKDAAFKIQDAMGRASLVEGLLKQLDHRRVPDALDLARDIDVVAIRARALTRLARLVPEEECAGVLREALEAARGIGDQQYRAEALSGLAAHLKHDQLGEILQMAGTLSSYARAKTLAAFAPHLSQQQLAQAVQVAHELEGDRYRGETLAELASHLTEEQLGVALRLAREIEGEAERTRTLTRLVAQLPEELREAEMGRLLVSIRRIQDAGQRAHALANLAQQANDDQFEEALVIARQIRPAKARALALTGLLPHSRRQQARTVAREALDAARGIAQKSARAIALAKLGEHLEEEARQELLVSVPWIGDEYYQMLTLNSLAPHLSRQHLSQAVEITRGLRSNWWRSDAVVGLAPYLDQTQRIEALDISQAIGEDYYRGNAVKGLAPYLPESQLEQALNVAYGLDFLTQPETLAALAPHLPSKLSDAVLVKVLEFADPGSLRNIADLLAAKQPQELYRAWRLKLDQCSMLERQRLLAFLRAFAPVLAKLGGRCAAREAASAMIATGRWWP